MKKNDVLQGYFTKDSFIIEVPIDETLHEVFVSFKNKQVGLFNLTFKSKKCLSMTLQFLHDFSTLFIKRLSEQPDLEVARENVCFDLKEEDIMLLEKQLPLTLGSDLVNDVWLRLQWTHLLKVYQELIVVYEDTVAKFLTDLDNNIHIADRIYFHLVENKQSEIPFAFIATYAVKTNGRTKHLPLMHALEEFKGQDTKLIKLISAVVKASEKSRFISEILDSGELFAPIELTIDEAYQFLSDVEIYESFGIMCRVPNWWKKKNSQFKLSVTIGDNQPSKVGLDAIMDFNPQVLFADENIKEEELRNFLNMADGLLLYKGNWIEINKKNIEKVLQALEQVKGMSNEELTVAEAMKLQLDLSSQLDISEDDIDISFDNGQWLEEMILALKGNVKKRYKLVDSFKATLRHYQEDGFNWLNQMNDFGFGACLADDMGLGKTVQIIAFLEKMRQSDKGQALLVLPASLIGNWESEIEKFAPDMPYQVLHKSKLKKGEIFEIESEKYLIITTYGMTKKIDFLKDQKWSYLILDEAQAIKNPATKQTKAIKSIPATMRIAMTGTPIENKLDDLWSLFDFLNQGLLGTPKEFKKFTKGLSEHPMGYAKLRKIIQPFILRRMKTDANIISDLPDKLEMNAYTLLSKKQEVLYRKLLKDIEKQLEEVAGINRKGLVLASIMKFKQICNHPDQYLASGEFKAENSGKFLQLKEICNTIYEKRERVIIFTQFRTMIEPLSEYLQTIFGQKGLVLHGGTPIKKRQELVTAFNGEAYVPYMVLSLKAGGVGLNLTSANHAIHFDRWWNPAVENQATDRIFRIGQKKNVMVHKFVTKGTVEEKINQMIEDKIQLSGDILMDTGEKWITELNNKELLDMFRLGGE